MLKLNRPVTRVQLTALPSFSCVRVVPLVSRRESLRAAVRCGRRSASTTISSARALHLTAKLPLSTPPKSTADVDQLEQELSRVRAEGEEWRQPPPAAAAEKPSAMPGGVEGEAAAEAWPEPTLEDLDRSIPQVDCAFMADLIRSRNARRARFLQDKVQLKARVEERTQRATTSMQDVTRLPALGGFNFWRQGQEGGEEASIAASSATAPVLASAEALQQLSADELDCLQSARPEYDDGFVLLDTRTVNEVTSWGIMEGAKVLPAHELFAAFHRTPEDFVREYGFAKPRPEQMIVCYCQYGPRSLMAAQILSWMGYLKVLHFRDGYYEWGKQYNLLLRRWMEHDKTSGNELRRLATFRAALEMQRAIAPEFNALPMQEAAQYEIDFTRSRGSLRIGDGLRAEAYGAVAQLVDGMQPTALPGVLDTDVNGEVNQSHLTQFLGQATGLDPLQEDSRAALGVEEAQASVVDAFTNRDGSARPQPPRPQK